MEVRRRGELRPPTGAAELLALDLPDAFVGEAAGAGAARPAGLDGVGAQVVGQPLQVAVADEGVLGQVTAEEGGEETPDTRTPTQCHRYRYTDGTDAPATVC